MRSDNVKSGIQQAPHRSLFNALGFTEEEMKKPMVGIVSSYNEIVPGHVNRSNWAWQKRAACRLFSRQLRYAMVLRWDISG